MWQSLCNYLNNYYGRLVLRQSLLVYFRLYSKHGFHSLDVYRNYLTKAGYLKIIRPGVYKVVRKIPKDISINKVYAKAYHSKDHVHVHGGKAFGQQCKNCRYGNSSNCYCSIRKYLICNDSTFVRELNNRSKSKTTYWKA